MLDGRRHMEHLCLKLRQEMWMLKEQHLDVALDLVLGDGAVTETLQDFNEAPEPRATQSVQHQLDKRHVVLHGHGGRLVARAGQVGTENAVGRCLEGLQSTSRVAWKPVFSKDCGVKAIF